MLKNANHAHQASSTRTSRRANTSRHASVACFIVTLALLASSCQTAQRDAANATNSNLETQVANANMSGNMNSSAPMMPSAQPVSTERAGTAMYRDADEKNRRGESYAHTEENPFRDARREPLSTFSIDVDTASYSNVRRFIKEGSLPPADAVRVEEFINYFTYDYPQPAGDAPFAVVTETAACPWNPQHKLVSIGLQGRRVQSENLPPANLVFLIDVSGSMQPAERLPLLKRALQVLVEQLSARDRISIVVYAGTSGLVLPSTSGDRKSDITHALNNLEAGGSTNGGDGIRLAYRVAQENFIRGGTNRVILATDGDFNVGTTSESELVSLIEEKRRGGVFLSVLGFGAGNLNDSAMESLADKGNGNYAYIDSFTEARKVLGAQVGGTLVTIAKDVKIQVEFNPAAASAYRLIGYENRILRDEDFNDDGKDAGEIGAGHSVTALYEVVPAGVAPPATAGNVTPLKYSQSASQPSQNTSANELLTVQLRYKDPTSDTSKLISTGVANVGREFGAASENLRFSAAVAAFGMLLKDSPHKGDVTYDGVRDVARGAMSTDLQGYRAEFVRLVGRAGELKRRGR